jgi:hypothetical protein
LIWPDLRSFVIQPSEQPAALRAYCSGGSGLCTQVLQQPAGQQDLTLAAGELEAHRDLFRFPGA